MVQDRGEVIVKEDGGVMVEEGRIVVVVAEEE